MTGERTTVGEIVKRLRSITGHLSRRDRDVVLQGVDAIMELSAKLYQRQEQDRPTNPKEGVTDGQEEERRQEEVLTSDV